MSGADECGWEEYERAAWFFHKDAFTLEYPPFGGAVVEYDPAYPPPVKVRF